MKNKHEYQTITKSGIKLLAVLFCLMLWQTAVSAQTLKADYRFTNSLGSSGVTPAPPAMGLLGTSSYATDTIDGYNRTTRSFPENNGFSANTSGVIPATQYTIIMLFKFDDVTGRRRIYDTKQGTSDSCGITLANGRFVGESPTSSPVMEADTYVQVAIVRQGNNQVQVYRDGFLIFNIADTNACYSISNNNPRFFRDNTTEASAGNVSRIRFYDNAMSTAQVRALDRLPFANGGGDQGILFTSYRNGQGDIYSMNGDGTNHKRLTTVNITEVNARWSPDKSRIVYTRFEGVGTTQLPQVWVMDASGLNQTRISSPVANTAYQNPVFKPDGTKIMYSYCLAPNYDCDIYQMNPDGTNPQPFIIGPEDQDRASFSVNGAEVIYTSINYDIQRSLLLARNLNNNNERVITNNPLPTIDLDGRFSPDGSKISFTRWTNLQQINTYEVFVIDANGQNPARLTNNNVRDTQPVWSPTGAELIFASSRDKFTNNPLGNQETDIYRTIPEEGGAVQRMTKYSSSNGMTDWFPLMFGGFSLQNISADFDGDNKDDISVFRPTNGTWYINQSTNGFKGVAFGASADILAPADYDGDGKTDIGVFRPSVGEWYYIRSSDNAFVGLTFGQDGDIPRPADYDGDGKADINVYREDCGFASSWYRLNSSNGSFNATSFGGCGDTPLVADYDGDGKTDIAVFRPQSANGSVFYWLESSTGSFKAYTFGITTDVPLSGDFDGDNKTDIAVFRQTNGAWYRINSSDGSFFGTLFGQAGDIPVPADYDGDNKTDIGVFRTGAWYYLKSSDGLFNGLSFGFGTDRPIPGAFQ